MSCAAGEFATGGGIKANGSRNTNYDFPAKGVNNPYLGDEVPTGWACYGDNDGGKGLKCYVICLRVLGAGAT